MLSFGSVFSGIGLLDYGLHLAGIRHAWFCEWDEWRRGILRKRWPGVPVYDDVRTVRAGCPGVDGIAGGFPCKGASNAGKREGFGHPETVLWHEMARAVGELRPRYVLVENVAAILGLHGGEVWGEVLGDLAAFGYDVVWDCLPAAAVGAPHLRDRVFAIATHADSVARSQAVALNRGRGSLDGPGEVERALGLHGQPASDSASTGGQGARPGRATLVGASPDDRVTAANPDRAGRVERGGRVSGEAELAAAERPGEAPANPERRVHGRAESGDLRGASGAGEGEAPERVRPDAADGGVTVEWGEYRGAIERWEAIAGPAPEPLIRGVDDRAAARVVRSRLSALGDGVQVQVGYIAGRYILEREEGRVAA